MLTVHVLSKSYDLLTLFENVSFSLNPGERIGLVGPNGCGKTTLLRILAGLEQPTTGRVTCAPVTRLGYLPQGFEPDPQQTIGAIIGQAAGNAAALEQQLGEVALALAERPDDETLLATYDDLLRRVESDETGRAAAILAGLGLDSIDPDLPAALLSGGQKTRLSLALVLLADPHLLLLDEPTNHLDIAMLEWLEEWLAASPCGALIISHDRTFLDATVTTILEMEPRKHTVKAYPGNYSNYLDQKQMELEKQWAAYNDQQMEIKRLKEDIARTKAQAAHTERMTHSARIGGHDMKGKGVKSSLQRLAKKVAQKAKSREKKLDRYVESDERVERPQGSWQIKIEFEDTPHLGRSVMELDDLTVGYAQDAPLLQNLRLAVKAGQRIAITGPNGAGKTTLLRVIAGQLQALAGQVYFGSTVRLGYMSQDQSSLNPAQTALDTVMHVFPNQTQARGFLASFLFSGDEALKPTALLSYGQRARLMLARLVAEECNCLLLDEPINHLDIPSRTQFEQALKGFSGTVLAVVHDRYFIERFAEEIWWVEDGTVTRQILEAV